MNEILCSACKGYLFQRKGSAIAAEDQIDALPERIAIAVNYSSALLMLLADQDGVVVVCPRMDAKASERGLAVRLPPSFPRASW